VQARKPPKIDTLPVGLQEIPVEEFAEPYLASMDNKGLVEIGFEKFLKKAPSMKGLKTQEISLMIDDVKVERPAIEIKVSQNADQKTDTQFTWDVAEVTSKGMKIQVLFDSPE
jgi:hypothetical protein